MPEYDVREIEQLVDGKLPWPRVQEIMKDAKDVERFTKWLDILQRRVAWPERILLPLTPALFIVQKGLRAHRQVPLRSRVRRLSGELEAVRADSRPRLGRGARSRSTAAPSSPIRRGCRSASTTCPGCGSQLEVEAVPRGTPPDFEFPARSRHVLRQVAGHAAAGCKGVRRQDAGCGSRMVAVNGSCGRASRHAGSRELHARRIGRFRISASPSGARAPATQPSRLKPAPRPAPLVWFAYEQGARQRHRPRSHDRILVVDRHGVARRFRRTRHQDRGPARAWPRGARNGVGLQGRAGAAEQAQPRRSTSIRKPDGRSCAS